MAYGSSPAPRDSLWPHLSDHNSSKLAVHVSMVMAEVVVESWWARQVHCGGSCSAMVARRCKRPTYSERAWASRHVPVLGLASGDPPCCLLPLGEVCVCTFVLPNLALSYRARATSLSPRHMHPIFTGSAGEVMAMATR